jgi:hypothetical protein
VAGRIAKFFCFGNDGHRAGSRSRLKMASNKRVSHFSACRGAASRMRSKAA